MSLFNFHTVAETMHSLNLILGAVALLFSLCFSSVFASFHYGNEHIVPNDIEEDFQNVPLLNDPPLLSSNVTEKQFYKDWTINLNETFAMRRTKRYSNDGTFVGHPKTREERWHATFNLNRTNSQMDQAESLVLLLIKVMDKYLNACTPIILYDQYVESSEGITLQTFFQVSQ